MWIAALLGVLWGLVIAVGGVVLSGAGDGWTGAWPFGLLCLIGCPAAVVGYVQGGAEGKIWALLALAVAFFVDVGLVRAAAVEFSYFKDVFEVALLWLGLVAGWQILAVWALLRRDP